MVDYRDWVLSELEKYGAAYISSYDMIFYDGTNPFNSRLTDELLRKLRFLHDIRVIKLVSCEKVDGSFLDSLSDLKLKEIHLMGVPISDASIKYLNDFKYLSVLKLTGNDLVDEAMSDIAMISSLKELQILSGSLTDLGIIKLANLKGLEYLDVTRTKIKEDTAAYIRQSLPGCELHLKVA
ncbi:hypothetical protein ONV78_16770 [Hahella sp. CR1]|uniref:hypothetical protein n=1 Tax=Hahella sp. CR1 TaxID=2992807 RepID=UPI0024421492|nr:hypothetical protein [Hahella sp. CR1]MDG9669394.1 hypothetical protein [Hahella sp. CR1]